MGRVALSRRATLSYLLTAVCVLLLDQASKALVRGTLSPGRTIRLVPGVFHLTYVRNTGAAFGLLPGRQVLFAAVAITIVTGAAAYWWTMRPTSRLLGLAFGLMSGGAVGNLIDRVLIGRVTDFMDVMIWPVFNVADSGIVIGVVLLVVLLLFEPERPRVAEGIAEGPPESGDVGGGGQ